MTAYLIFFLALCVGGGLGAVARAAISAWISRRLHLAWGTLVVNMTGSFLLGLALGWVMARTGPAPLSVLMAGAPSFLAVFILGVLGGYTTVSTLALQVVTLWQAGQRRAAYANALGSVLSGPVVVAMGVVIGARAFAPWVAGG
ncbi:MAG: CrcB family protein [Rhodobacteraceae bacterium]|nr:CrcB family protein [Paracoccaceae bacterium]